MAARRVWVAAVPDVLADGPEAAHQVAAAPLAVFAATCSGGSAQVGGRIAASQMDSLSTAPPWRLFCPAEKAQL